MSVWGIRGRYRVWRICYVKSVLITCCPNYFLEYLLITGTVFKGLDIPSEISILPMLSFFFVHVCKHTCATTHIYVCAIACVEVER